MFLPRSKAFLSRQGSPNLYSEIVTLLLAVVFRIVRRLDRRAFPAADVSRVRRVLVFSTTAIGDTLMNTPAIRALRKALPAARITAVADRRRADLLRHNPHLDHLIVYPGKFRRVRSLVRELRAVQPDWAIILHGNDPDIPILAYLSGAPIRAGWSESRFSFLLTQPLEIPKNLPFVRRRTEMIERLGVKSDGDETEFHLPPDAGRRLETRLAELGASLEEGFVALHPFGSRRSKWWPADDARAFVGLIARETGRRCVVLGGEREREAAARFFGDHPDRPAILCGALNLIELGALLVRSMALISTDSGPMHLGFALGVPTVALFGPEDWRDYGVGARRGAATFLMGEAPCPRPCKKKECDQPGHPCMSSIGVEMVLGAVRDRIMSPAAVPE